MTGLRQSAVNGFHRIKTALTQIQPPLVGMEISQTSIKAVRIERIKGGWRLVSRAKLPIDETVLKLQYKKPNVLDEDAFQAAVQETAEAVGGGIDRISISLPNQIIKASVQTYEALPSAGSDAERMVKWRMEQSLCSPAENLKISYEIIGENKTGEKRLLSAVGFQNVIQQYESLLKDLNIQAAVIRPAGINQLNFYGKEFSFKEVSAYLGFFHQYFIFAVIDRRRLVFYHGIRADISSFRFLYHLEMMYQYFKDIHPDLVIERLYLGHPGKRYYPRLSESLKTLFTPQIECLEEKEMMFEEYAASTKYDRYSSSPARLSSLHAYTGAIGAAQALTH